MLKCYFCDNPMTAQREVAFAIEMNSDKTLTKQVCAMCEERYIVNVPPIAPFLHGAGKRFLISEAAPAPTKAKPKHMGDLRVTHDHQARTTILVVKLRGEIIRRFPPLQGILTCRKAREAHGV
jgi:hypothetical protein